MGEPVGFTGSNVTLAPAPGDEERVRTMPARYDPATGCLVSCWELSDLELLEIVNTKRVWLSVNVGRSPPPPVFVTAMRNDAFA